jgi:hypothetical protein
MDLYAVERNNAWGREAASIGEQVLELLEDNPLAEFYQAEFDFDDVWEPYDRDKVVSFLAENGEAAVSLRGSTPFLIMGSIALDYSQNAVGLGFSYEYLTDERLLSELPAYLSRWRGVLPAFAWGGINADDRENEYFFDKLAMLPVPDCFGNTLGWYQVVSPRGYGKYYKPEDLRHAPAYRVEKFGDGSFALMTYAHPLEFATEENTRRLVELTNYLYDRWKANGGHC